MLTSQIETYAARGDLATGDFNIQAVLRHSVIPAFLVDVGEVAWRRVNAVLTLSVGVKNYDLPADFEKLSEIYGQGDSTSQTYDNPLTYIGEDPRRVSIAEQASPQVQQPPTGYYIVAGATNDWAVKLDNPPDYAYVLPYVYYSQPVFPDDTTAVELKSYIPNGIIWGLVDGLRAEIMLDRFGQNDPRYQEEQNKRDKWIVRAKAFKHELAHRNYSKFGR